MCNLLFISPIKVPRSVVSVVQFARSIPPVKMFKLATVIVRIGFRTLVTLLPWDMRISFFPSSLACWEHTQWILSHLSQRSLQTTSLTAQVAFPQLLIGILSVWLEALQAFPEVWVCLSNVKHSSTTGVDERVHYLLGVSSVWAEALHVFPEASVCIPMSSNYRQLDLSNR